MSIIQTAPGLTEQVYQAILDEICDGVLPPGAHLVQEQLAERFGVSRQPVQQALALLKSDGLIQEIGKRGLRVAELDLTLMQQHYAAAKPSRAARSAALRAKQDPAVAAQIEEAGSAMIERGLGAVERKDTLEQIRADEAFHKLIYEASGNPLLTGTAEVHWRFLRRVMSDVLRRAQPPVSIWSQHAAILAAVVAGDEQHAETRASDHIGIAASALAEAYGASPDSLLAPAESAAS
ncbi:MAG: GntR family transcriptional regulator [Limibacillus sp.]